MTYSGEVKFFLIIEVIQGSEGILLSQRKYIEDFLKKFDMESCKLVAIPMLQNQKFTKEDGSGPINASVLRSLIGGLLFVCSSRLEIIFSVRFMHAPTQINYATGKRILRYLKGTTDYGVSYHSSENILEDTHIVIWLEIQWT